MDINTYDAKTAALIRKTLDQQTEMQPAILRSTARLKKTARETNDDALMGFAFYHEAEAYYSLEIDYEKFRKSLSQAITCLRRASEPELLTRAYNLVGIDASNNGSFDVAYYYYMTALRTAEDLDDEYLKGIANANIGQVYERLGNMKEARKYVKESRRQLAKGSKEDIFYYHNQINGCFSEAMLDIELGNIAAVERLSKKIDKLEIESGGRGIESARIPVMYLRTQLALMHGHKKEYRKFLDETIRMLKEAHQIFDYMKETTSFCTFLLDNNNAWAVREILDIITDKIEETGIIQMKLLVSTVELAYYEKIGDTEQATRHLRNLHRLTTEQEKEQNRIYLYSIELIGTMDTMRKEQERMRRENRNLQRQAQTDALTGIPNRLMLNRILEDAFERAYADKTPFCLEILDIDNFKEYNDTYGHQAGDKCLKRVANEISKIANKEGIHCARYGGDEFVLIYEDMTDKEALKIARRLERRIYSLNIPHKADRHNNRVVISQGLCNSVPGKKNKIYDYLTEADNALYAVKKNQSKSRDKDAIRLCHLPENFG